MLRDVESWYLWITVDIIYIPLYASQGLYLTTILHGYFLLMAIQGLQNFKRIYLEQQLSEK
jgi:nicotinamide mononucleotide transporter